LVGISLTTIYDIRMNYSVGGVTVTYEIVELMCLALCLLYLVENLSYEIEISLCLLAAGCPSFDMYKIVHSIHVWYMSLWLHSLIFHRFLECEQGDVFFLNDGH
jgi:hypothetical protein